VAPLAEEAAPRGRDGQLTTTFLEVSSLLVQIRQEAPAVLTQDRPALLSRRELLGLSFLWFALNFTFAALLPIVIPAQIVLFIAPGAAGNAQQALFLGGLAALGAVTAVIIQPVAGALSDRTRSRLGRRRPYVLGGGVIMLGGLTLLAATHNMALYVAGLFLVVVANTVSGAAFQGLVPDRVPAEQRGVASGYVGLMTLLGTVGSLAVASLLLGQGGGHGSAAAGLATAHGAALFYGLGALVLLGGIVVTFVGVRETPHFPLHLPHHHAAKTNEDTSTRRERLARMWLAPWRHANFTWVFLTRGFVMLGLALFMTYIEYYFARVAHLTNFVQATAINAIMALLGAVASTLLLGALSDRMRRRVPIVFGASACMALAALAFVVAPGQIPLWPLGILFGLGYGAYMSVDVALAIDALPSRSEAGKDLGLWSTASTLPGILAPMLGSVVIFAADRFGETALGYRAVFGLATLFLVLGAAFILKVRETRRTHEEAAPVIAEAETSAN
jgi:MFS family permease